MTDDAHDHAHGHSHSHSHSHSHGHSHAVRGDEGRVRVALALTFVFLLVEVAGAFWSGSLALLADAGHMLADVLALTLAYVAYRVARRPADRRRSYGYARVQVLVSFVNGLFLCGIAVRIGVEAILRLRTPTDVEAAPLAVVAALGLLVNVVVFFVLHGGDRRDLNLRAATLHVLADLLGSVAALAAGIVLLLTEWRPIDSLLSLAVVALILVGAVKLVRRTAHILLEGAPDDWQDVDVAAAVQSGVPGVVEVHHVHAWSLTLDRSVVTLHAKLRDDADPDAALAGIKRTLHERFGIDHATVQLESGPCPDVADVALPGCER